MITLNLQEMLQIVFCSNNNSSKFRLYYLDHTLFHQALSHNYSLDRQGNYLQARSLLNQTEICANRSYSVFAFCYYSQSHYYFSHLVSFSAPIAPHHLVPQTFCPKPFCSALSDLILIHQVQNLLLLLNLISN